MVYYGLQNTALALVVVAPFISTVVVALRLYCKLKTNRIGLDDYLIVAALTFSLAQIYPYWSYIKLAGIGIHVYDLHDYDWSEILKYQWLTEILYRPSFVLVKCSVLLFIHRLGQSVRYLDITIWIVFWFNLTWGFIAEIVNIFQCTPVDFMWDRWSTSGGYCIDRSFFMATNAVNVATDILTLLPPIIVYSKMKMRARLKIIVLGIFLVGFVVTGISIWRWVMIIQILYTGKPVADPSYDISFISVSLEPNTAILAASVPALRSLFKRARTHSPDEEKVPKSPQLEHPPTVGHQPNRNRWQQRIGTLLRTAPPTRQDPIHQCESAKTSMQDFSGTASINYHDMLANMTSDPTRNGSEQTAVEWTKAEHASRTSSPT